MSAYAFILCIVLAIQVTQSRAVVATPSNSNAVAVEDRLNSSIVIYEESPVMLVNKSQMLIDKKDPSMVPIIKNQTVYVPTSFFRSAYNAVTSEDISSCSATIRLDNQALVLDLEKADLVDSIREIDIEYNNKVFMKNGCIYVPLDMFAEAFDKYLYYYDKLVIMSDTANAFTNNESHSFITNLTAQVNDLPYVANEENMKEITNIGSPTYLLQPKADDGKDKAKTNVKQLKNKERNTICGSGNHIYYGNDNTVFVLDTSSGDPVIVSTLTPAEDFHVEKLYLQNNSLVVIGDKANKDNSNIIHSSTAYVYSVANPTMPSMQKCIEVEGYYENSSINNGYVYIMSKSPVTELSKDGHYYSPSYIDSALGENTNSIPFSDMQYFPEGNGKDYTVIYSINLEMPYLQSELKSYLCAGDNIYMSQTCVYITKNRFNAYNSNENVENTFIYKLGFSEGKIYNAGNGNVMGYVPHKSAIDEYSGYLRIVTQYKKRGTGTNSTNVYILNNNLEECGYANEVMLGADINNVIFAQNRLFITPMNSSKIYSMDLSVPTNPVGNGTIEISNGNILLYLYDENHILTVDDGNTKLSLNLFNISEKDNVQKLYNQELGVGNITSNLFDNAENFYFDKEKNIFSLPVTIYNSPEKIGITFNGSYIYSVDLDDSFERLGAIPTPSNATLKPYKQNGKMYSFMGNTAVAIDYENINNSKEYRFK